MQTVYTILFFDVSIEREMGHLDFVFFFTYLRHQSKNSFRLRLMSNRYRARRPSRRRNNNNILYANRAFIRCKHKKLYPSGVYRFAIVIVARTLVSRLSYFVSLSLSCIPPVANRHIILSQYESRAAFILHIIIIIIIIRQSRGAIYLLRRESLRAPRFS